jgi:hypothetical protein
VLAVELGSACLTYRCSDTRSPARPRMAREGELSGEVLEAVWVLLEIVDVDAKQRKIIGTIAKDCPFPSPCSAFTKTTRTFHPS